MITENKDNQVCVFRCAIGRAGLVPLVSSSPNWALAETLQCKIYFAVLVVFANENFLSSRISPQNIYYGIILRDDNNGRNVKKTTRCVRKNCKFYRVEVKNQDKWFLILKLIVNMSDLMVFKSNQKRQYLKFSFFNDCLLTNRC